MWNGDLWCCDDVNDLVEIFFICDQNETIQLLRGVCVCLCVSVHVINRGSMTDVCMLSFRIKYSFRPWLHLCHMLIISLHMQTHTRAHTGEAQ